METTDTTVDMEDPISPAIPEEAHSPTATSTSTRARSPTQPPGPQVLPDAPQPEPRALPTPKKRVGNLDRDQRLRVRTLRDDAGWTYAAISSKTGFTYRQIQHACTNPIPPAPGTRRGNATVEPEDRERLTEWYAANSGIHHVPWRSLQTFVPPDLRHYTIPALSTALQSGGFQRPGGGRGRGRGGG
ncbi:uncharacterized protein DNG_08746 [Cephalotrichum gorgonifer]|uniref:Uncharacterized protein n=1 Tax=Cephalotrichum gorgonifer TaxID=2041049 RepID=A0AAE8N718_9PEZI|nr:uncharacterized protein DNG_08746 [Cephalotrichum gorgonifer]